jgi:hypothetical protein
MPTASRLKVQIWKWWTLPPIVIVLGFNILLERKRPTMPGLVHFAILLAVSAISFGVVFSIAWLICRCKILR